MKKVLSKIPVILIFVFNTAVILFFIYVVFSVSSCVKRLEMPTDIEDVIPWGVWKSETPPMVMYVKPEYKMNKVNCFTFPGVYELDGEERKIHIEFRPQPGFRKYGDGYRPHFLRIYDVGEHRNSSHYSFTDRRGPEAFQVIDEQLRLVDGDVTLIFNRLDSYDPIEPDD